MNSVHLQTDLATTFSFFQHKRAQVRGMTKSSPQKTTLKKSSLSKFFSRFDRAILIDIVVRASLAVFFAFSAGVYYRNALVQLHATDMTQLSAASVSQGLSIFAGALYTMMIACLYVLRHRPINKFVGWWPSFAAVFGGFLMFGLIWFKPDMELSTEWRITGCCLIFAGNILAFYILAHLGRSFSILPESRKLVTSGPYKIVRHPLYVAEVISSIGQMILFISFGAVVLVVAQTLLQLVRMHYEEKVLTQHFPEYKSYAKRTARLIPGLY